MSTTKTLSQEERLTKIMTALNQSKELETQFSTNRVVIQSALNEDASLRWIWEWLKTEGLFTGSYVTFTRMVRRHNLRKQTRQEIEKERESQIVKDLF